MKPNSKRTNPYTQLAELHNRGIDYVFRKLKEKQNYSEEIEFETVLEIASEYIAKIQNDKSKANKAANYAVLANLLNMDRDKVIDEMLIQKEVPREVIRYLDKVRNLTDNMHSVELVRKLSEVESQLLDSNYSNDQIKYVLLYIAIAKGSIKDWQKNYNLRFPERQEDKGWPWKEDSESALQAALVGPIDFFLTGGVLTVVSVVGGSVVASSWSAIKRRKNG